MENFIKVQILNQIATLFRKNSKILPKTGAENDWNGRLPLPVPSLLGTVTWDRILAVCGLNTVQFNDRTVCISAPDIMDRIQSRILRPGCFSFTLLVERSTTYKKVFLF